MALPSAVAFAVLADSLAGGLFERGAFGPHEDTRTPMIAALCGLATSVLGSLVLFPVHGHVGIAAAIAGSGWVGATLLAAILWRRRWFKLDRTARRRLPLLALATALMAAIILLGHALLTYGFDLTGSAVARLTTLGMLVVAGLAGYLAALQALGAADLPHVIAAIKRRL